MRNATRKSRRAKSGDARACRWLQRALVAWREEKGAIMLEAVIVYPLTWFLLAYILAAYMVFYQSWNMQVVANEVATLVGETAKYSNASGTKYSDAIKNAVALGDGDLTTLRNLRVAVSDDRSLREGGSESGIKKRIEQYVAAQLSSATLVQPVHLEGTKEAYTSARIVEDGLGRAHVEVTVSCKYFVMFGDILSLFGYDPLLTISKTSYAQLLDLSDYLQTTQAVFAARDVERNLGITNMASVTGRARN